MQSPILRRPVRILFLAGALFFSSHPSIAAAQQDQGGQPAENTCYRAVDLAVSGSSAGITTDYFEQRATEALEATGMFDCVINISSARIEMKMTRTKSFYEGPSKPIDAPYLLRIRIIRLETPSFSIHMTAGMNVLWEFIRTTDNATLAKENIHSSYTGGMFEGGVVGASRVRAAVEGATRENVRIGMELLTGLNLDRI